MAKDPWSPASRLLQVGARLRATRAPGRRGVLVGKPAPLFVGARLRATRAVHGKGSVVACKQAPTGRSALARDPGLRPSRRFGRQAGSAFVGARLRATHAVMAKSSMVACKQAPTGRSALARDRCRPWHGTP